jgi:hypothetical protein
MEVLQSVALCKEAVFMHLHFLQLGSAMRNGLALVMDVIAIVELGILIVRM